MSDFSGVSYGCFQGCTDMISPYLQALLASNLCLEVFEINVRVLPLFVCHYK